MLSLFLFGEGPHRIHPLLLKALVCLEPLFRFALRFQFFVLLISVLVCQSFIGQFQVPIDKIPTVRQTAPCESSFQT